MIRSFRLLMTTDAIGGVWTYCLELSQALAPHGVEIALACMGAAPSTAQRAEIDQLPNVELFFNPYALEWMDDPWAQVDAAGEWLLKLQREFRPETVHLNGYVHAALPWEAPVIVVAHSCVLSWWDAVKGEGAPSKWAEYGHRVGRGLRHADLVIAPTTAMLDALSAHYAYATPGRVIPNGRSADRFTPGEKRPVIFSAGRLWDEAKNTALLQRLAPRLAWPLHLAGAARLSAASSMTDHPQKTTLLGQLSPMEMAGHLATASIYAAPARYEPFGLGILEAALSGCALVLSDLPSLRENWSEAAVFVAPDDEEGWLRALNELAEQPARRAELSAQARSRALRLTPAKMADAYHLIYQELIAAAPESCPVAA